MLKTTNKKLKLIISSLLIIVTFTFCIISTTIVVCADIPVGRTSHAMIYDSVNDRVILYGGSKGTEYDDWRHDMWEYDYNTDTWTIIDKTNRPFGRYATDMVYDSERYWELAEAEEVDL